VSPATLVTAAPLDQQAVISAVVEAPPSFLSTEAPGAKVEGAPGVGAVSIFLGLVRDHNKGRKVLHLEYEAYEPLALRGLDLIVAEAREKWPTVRLAIHHRIGRMEIGEASVAIAAASPHRADAFATSRYAIERIKQIVPIWKHEYFEGGDVWIEGATADPDNADAREEALRIACA
jgi:molybdopterin synthase catalytic subunit